MRNGLRLGGQPRLTAPGCGAGSDGDGDARLHRLAYQQAGIGRDFAGGDDHEVVIGECAVALDAVVAHVPVDHGEDFHRARPVLGPDRGFQRARVRCVHGGDPALQHPAGPAGRVAETELAGQFGSPQIHRLAVGQYLGGVDVEPVAAVDAELERQPVRQVDHALVLDTDTGHLVGEPVEEPCGVGAGVVVPAGIGLRRAAPRRAVAVADGAERLAQPLLVGDVPAVGERPRRGHDLAVDIAVLHQSFDELPDPVGIVQTEPRGGGPVAILVMAHHDPDPVVQDGVEGVLVGQVIAEEYRNQRLLTGHVVKDPLQGRALVPVDVGPQLDDLAA